MKRPGPIPPGADVPGTVACFPGLFLSFSRKRAKRVKDGHLQQPRPDGRSGLISLVHFCVQDQDLSPAPAYPRPCRGGTLSIMDFQKNHGGQDPKCARRSRRRVWTVGKGWTELVTTPSNSPTSRVFRLTPSSQQAHLQRHQRNPPDVVRPFRLAPRRLVQRLPLRPSQRQHPHRQREQSPPPHPQQRPPGV